MIERFGGRAPMWWGGVVGAANDETWTTDPLLGVRFARREDAEMVIVGVLGYKITSSNVHATEHEWCDGDGTHPNQTLYE
jgi:hypothetical protein